MMKKLDKNYYSLLGCARDADDATLKKAYRAAALIAHPDKGGTDEEFQAINEAWQVLSDATKRADYDRVRN
jgi:DnaJ family protein C protein 3